MQSDAKLKYSAVVAMCATSMGFSVAKVANTSNFVVESVDPDITIVSTTPNYVRTINPQDIIVGVSLFSVTKNTFSGVKTSAFFEMACLPKGSLVRLDLRRPNPVISTPKAAVVHVDSVPLVPFISKDFATDVSVSIQSPFSSPTKQISNNSISSHSLPEISSSSSSSSSSLPPNEYETLSCVPPTKPSQSTYTPDDHTQLSFPPNTTQNATTTEVTRSPDWELFDFFQSELIRLQTSAKASPSSPPSSASNDHLHNSEAINKSLRKQVEEVTDRLRTANVAIQRLTQHSKLQETTREELLQCKTELAQTKDAMVGLVPRADLMASQARCADLEATVGQLRQRLTSCESQATMSSRRLEEASERIEVLQDLVDEYKVQLEAAHIELAEREDELMERTVSCL